jgi:tetratricopeptide (TPR) repeat protein
MRQGEDMSGTTKAFWARVSVIAVLLIIAVPVFAQGQEGGEAPGAAPLSAMQNYRRGWELQSNDRRDDAQAYYNEAIRLCQDEVSRNAATRDTYTVITWAMYRQGRYAEVISWGDRGLRQYADEFRIVETMGEAYFYLENYPRSLACMQRYASARPQGERISVAYFFIGEIYRLTQKPLHADIAYTTAVRLESSLPHWWYRLATVREQSGDRRSAEEAYQQALRLNPNYREAREGLTRVTQTRQ